MKPFKRPFLFVDPRVFSSSLPLFTHSCYCHFAEESYYYKSMSNIIQPILISFKTHFSNQSLVSQTPQINHLSHSPTSSSLVGYLQNLLLLLPKVSKSKPHKNRTLYLNCWKPMVSPMLRSQLSYQPYLAYSLRM